MKPLHPAGTGIVHSRPPFPTISTITSGFPSIAADPIVTSRFPSVADRARLFSRPAYSGPIRCRRGQAELIWTITASVHLRNWPESILLLTLFRIFLEERRTAEQSRSHRKRCLTDLRRALASLRTYRSNRTKGFVLASGATCCNPRCTALASGGTLPISDPLDGHIRE
jgi:hypothetical protein